MLLFLIIKKNSFFLKLKKDKHQLFVQNKFIPPVGGFLLFFFLIFSNPFDYAYFSLFISLIFFLGVLSDIKKFNSPKYRLFMQIAIILIFVYLSGLNLESTRINYLDHLLKNNFFNILFVSFCILIVINGTNFIDGLNGLIIMYYGAISIIILNSGLDLSGIINETVLFNLIIILIILLFLNMLNILYLGDSGSYSIGFIFSIFLIKLYLTNQFISPYFIILLLWYPCFENLFSIIRKFKYKFSPTVADTKHLHQLIFISVYKLIGHKFASNNLSSILIIIYNLLVFAIGFNFATKTSVQVILIVFSIFTYLLIYIFLKKSTKLTK